MQFQSKWSSSSESPLCGKFNRFQLDCSQRQRQLPQKKNHMAARHLLQLPACNQAAKFLQLKWPDRRQSQPAGCVGQRGEHVTPAVMSENLFSISVRWKRFEKAWHLLFGSIHLPFWVLSTINAAAFAGRGIRWASLDLTFINAVKERSSWES